MKEFNNCSDASLLYLRTEPTTEPCRYWKTVSFIKSDAELSQHDQIIAFYENKDFAIGKTKTATEYRCKFAILETDSVLCQQTGYCIRNTNLLYNDCCSINTEH